MIYEKLKKLIKTVLPKKLLVNQEPRLRKLVYQFYKGNNFECPICERKLHRFIRLKTGDRLCPNCGSLDRHRRLWSLVQPLLNNGVNVLDFSPPRCLFRKLETMPNIEYTPTDFAGEFLASSKFDITHLELENNSYDLIICYHILEHIEKDIQAMRELYKVLKRNGSCFIQTPFRSGNIYEDASIQSSKERKQHFGQEDHVRIYSVDGLTQRLASVGFSIERMNFSEEKNNYHGFHENETVLVTKKIKLN